jgi:hypothetical protein
MKIVCVSVCLSVRLHGDAKNACMWDGKNVFYSVSRETVRGIQYRLPLSVVPSEKRKRKTRHTVYISLICFHFGYTANDILNHFSLFIQHHGIRSSVPFFVYRVTELKNDKLVARHCRFSFSLFGPVIRKYEHAIRKTFSFYYVYSERPLRCAFFHRGA